MLHTVMNMSLRVVTALCLLWSIAWISVGATASGKAWYSQLTAALSFQDTKGGLPLIVLVIPMLLAAASIHLFALREPQVKPPSKSASAWKRVQKWILCRGDVDFVRASAVIIVPCLFYAICSTYRHLQEGESDLNDKIMDAANAQGMAALIAMSFLFVPVARYSPFLRIMNWNPACAIQLHVWIGRLVVLCSLLHGGMHMWRWKFTLLGEDWSTLLIPPGPCWSMSRDSDFAPTCRNSETDCTCYHLFRNLTGFLAGIGLVVIVVSSLNVVRRSMYVAFYKIHIVAGPLVIIMTILHYNKAILYMAGGLLLYIASSFPVLVESRVRRQQGVKITNVQTIAGSEESGTRQRPCVSLTVEASDTAMAQFRSGQHVRVRLPAVSAQAHPFSVNLVPNQSHQLRVIFRVVGPFTSALASHLKSEKATVCMEGLFGAGNRLEQVLHHDTIVIVAGGIGITSYLSLLHQIQSNVSRHPRQFPLRRVVLHWICRDPSLVQYITREYLDTLRESPCSPGFRMDIIVHHTNVAIDGTRLCSMGSFYDLENPQGDLEPISKVYDSETILRAADGIPFAPSVFAPASKTCYKRNLVSFISFSLTALFGIQVIWYLYANVQSGDNVMNRLLAPLFVAGLGLFVAMVANAVAYRLSADEEPTASPEWMAVSTSAHDSLELSHMVPPSDAEDHANAVEQVTEDEERGAASMEEREGRPSIHQFMNVFDGARQPGLLACGPESLLRQVRDVVGDRCAARVRQCIKGGAKIALYEESFQI